MEEKRGLFSSLNGGFKIFREVIYVLAFIITMTLAWGNLTNAVELNALNIESNSKRLDKLEVFYVENEKQHATIIANQNNILKQLEKIK